MEVYFYIDKALGWLFYIFNILSMIYSILNHDIRKILKHNKEMVKDSDECFILGNGPSISGLDLQKLEGRDTFTVNWFYKSNLSYFQSKFFIAIDEQFYKTEIGRNYLNEIYKKNNYTKIILDYRAYGQDKWDLTRTFFIYQKLFQYGKFVQCDPTKNMTACINVVLQCIQIAISLGYKRIYLLGCEFNHYATRNSKNEHFYSKYLSTVRQENRINMGDYARWSYLAHYHHYALEKYAQTHGIEIINLTENSLIDAYRFEKLESVIK